ncbi:hypothetical protein F5888DRAFT_69499 [Russula emetica]|nr:hypothetical protein F5888DRAFT_69499 [Russula emetica]
MIIRPVARNTTALTTTYTCAPENPYCLSTQRVSDNDTSSSATGNTSTSTSTATPLLTHRNLVGILVIATLLALGLILWLCFGKWSKPIRHFLRGEQRHKNVRFGIGDCLTAAPIDRHLHGTGATTITTSKQSKAPPGPRSGNTTDSDVEKAEMVDSSSISTQSSLDQEGIKIDKDKEETKAKLELEPTLPAKVRLPGPGRDTLVLLLTRKTSITDHAWVCLAGTACVYNQVWQSACTSRSIISALLALRKPTFVL